MRRTALLLALLTLVPLVACGDDGAGGSEGAGEVETTPLTFGDGSEVWLRVQSGGGYVPLITVQREVPSVLLFDDGRLVRNVVEDDGLPGVVPRFEEVRLDEEATTEILDDIAAVVDGPEVGDPPVTDLGTTTIEVTTDGDTRSLDVYALGVNEGLTDDQVDARRAVESVLADLGQVGEAEPYVPDAWFVLTMATEGQVDGVSAVPWPLDPDRGASTETPNVCTRIAGDEVEPVLAAFDAGDDDPFIDTGTAIVEVALRPVLTGEETCNLGEFDEFVER